MAEGHESVTEVDDDDANQKGRRRFGRRKEAPKELRSETEWVDTLVAHEGSDEEPLAGSPLAAGEEETEEPPALPEVHEPSGPTGELPDEAAEMGDEVVIRERQLYRPDKLALENRVRAAHRHRGERDAFYEKSWNRRQADTHEDIRNFIDNVLGTESDPSRRRERLGRAGMPPSRVQKGEQTAPVHVEGLEGDIMIAFTFPKEEFRSARVVYETEGGYVVEVTRAVGNVESRLATQYYTVSRVGEVGHVLDKMRAREAERRAREEGIEPVAPIGGPEPEVPDEGPPAPEDVGAPGATDPDHAPEEAPEPPVAGQAETEAETEAGTEAGSEEGGKKKGFGLFKRKKEGEGPETGAAEADAEGPAPAPGPGDADGPEDAEKKKGFGLFKRKKGEDGAEAEDAVGEGGSESENQA